MTGRRQAFTDGPLNIQTENHKGIPMIQGSYEFSARIISKTTIGIIWDKWYRFFMPTSRMSSPERSDLQKKCDQLLHTISATSTIGNDDVLLNVEKVIKKAKVQELIDSGVHKYAITQLKGGGYQTHVKDNDGKRHIIHGRSEEAFYCRLYKFYFGDKARLTMCDLFEEWIQRETKTNLSPRTIKKYRENYEKYLEGTVLDTTPIAKVTPEMVTEFFNGLIGDLKLTDKQYGNIIVIPNKLFSYATFKMITPQNPMTDAMINRRALVHTSVAKTSDRVYYEEERKMFIDALMELIDEKPDLSDYYAILILWVLALRIGELTALKWSDIDYSAKQIHIQRMESRDANNKPDILDHCKGNSPTAERILDISDYELGLFAQICELNERYGFDSEFVFVGYNYKTGRVGRRTNKNIDSSIRRVCKRAGIPEKSAHDIRRTVASMLFSKGESLESIRMFLGHSNIRTTMEYIVDYSGAEDRSNRFHAILANDLPMKSNSKDDSKKDKVVRFKTKAS